MATTLPDLCLHRIFDFISLDQETHASTLHSSVLVNRHWCHSLISLLWKDPFGLAINATSRKRLIKSYISFLPNDEQQTFYTLITCNDHLQSNKNNAPSFDYFAFLRTFSVTAIMEAVNLIANDNWTPMSYRYIVKTLSRQFMTRSPVILNTELSLGGLGALEKWDGQLWMLRGNLRTLKLNGKFLPDVLVSAAKVARNIEELDVGFDGFDEEDDINRWLQPLSQLIRAQKKLRSFSLNIGQCDVRALAQVFTALQGCAKSLLSVRMVNVDFQGYPILDALSKCGNLSSLVFDGCANLPETLNINECAGAFYKLKNLELTRMLVPSSMLQSLLSQSNGAIHTIIFSGLISGDLMLTNFFDLLATFCPNLHKLSVFVRHESIYNLLSHLGSWPQLEQLEINGGICISNVYTEVDDLMPLFGKAVPSTLQRLEIRINWEFSPEALRGFFENCTASLEHLNLEWCKLSDEHIDQIVKHCNGRLKYLNIENAVDVTWDGYKKAIDNIKVVRLSSKTRTM
ncbi:5597_t:CDS:2 [Paraglomus occultum]|uniref:5597_t:CDS:1 n=1 Tax=Paraglomus occultum TaxID=144539 RepID=A0A9N9A9E6_9GLOM|nr:5597_t:CDS:2 [Paraglomus occultum]